MLAIMKIRSILLVLIVVLFGLGLLVYAAMNARSTVTAERVFKAPNEKIWKLMTEADSIQKWWGPTGYTSPKIENDPREGGRLLFGMRSTSGQTHWNTGTYTAVVPQRKLVARFSFANESGQPVPAKSLGLPGDWPDEIIMTIELNESEGQTEVKVTEAGIPMIMYFFAQLGWKQQFDKIEALLQ